MWPSIKHWRDWAMHELWPMHRSGPQPQALHFSYEKAGLTLHDQPIPWNAEAVLVEALLRLPSVSARRKGDFQVRLPRQEPVPAESLRKEETSDDRYHLFFRLPVPQQSTFVEVLWKNHILGQLTLPVLTCEDFLRNLRLQMPTLFVRIADESVACQTFVATQCRGLLASAVLISPTSLVPLLDIGLQVELRSERSAATHRVPARLCSSQLAGRQALVTVVPRKFPRRIGTWQCTWLVGDRPLASQQIRAISQRTFQRSLRVSDVRFIVQRKEGMTQTRHVPPPEAVERVGPCFLVSSREAGMAGVCRLQVRAQVTGAISPPLLVEEDVLITDGPTMVAPGTLDAGDLGQVNGFELKLKGTQLGAISICPAPTAVFTAEGGFKAPQEFSWSPAADEELNDRLSRLMEQRGNGS